eukprot:gene20284-27042_t
MSHGYGCGFTSDFIWDAQAVDLLVGRWGTDTIAPLAMCASMALVRLPAQLHDALCKGGDEAGTEVEKQEEGGATAGAATSADAKYVQDLLHYDHAIECPVKCQLGLLNDLLNYDHAIQMPPGAAVRAAVDLLHYDHAIECPVKCHQGLLYVRLSCAVYNCIEDYEALATAIAVIMEKVGCADK